MSNRPAVAWLAPVGDGKALSLAAVTSIELNEKRDIGTYAAVTAGAETVSGVSGRTRTVTFKGVTTNVLSYEQATRVIAGFSEYMTSGKPVRFVSRDAVFATALLQSFTATAQSGSGAIEIEATVREVLEIELTSVPGIKSKTAPKEAGTKGRSIATKPNFTEAKQKKANKAVEEAKAKPKGSILFRTKNSVSDFLSENF